MRAKRVLLVALLATMLLGITGAAGASTIIAEPSGAIRMVSAGRFSFVGGLGGVACNLTLTGTIVREAVGTLTERPEPAINPVLGSMTAGTTSECTLGSSVQLLGVGADGLWKFEGWKHREEKWYFYILHVLYLVETSSWACLFDALITVIYDERTKVWSVDATEYLRVTTLRGICGIEHPAGAFRIEPPLTFRLV